MGFTCCMSAFFAPIIAPIVANWHLLFTIFLIQGILGVILVEKAWKGAERVRGYEELYRNYPSYRRADQHLWSRWNHYPGAFTIFLPRVVWVFGWFFLIGFWQKILFTGQDYAVPLSGWRRTLHKWMLWTHVPMLIIGFGYRVKLNDHDEDEVDYSKYLGPKWRENKFKGKRVSTIISNHVGFLDILTWMSVDTPPAFSPASHIKKFPIGDHYVAALQSIYVDRGLSKEGLDKCVQTVIERQKLTESDDADWGPLCVFAEGTVTNGKDLSRFRRGGFAGNVACRPQYLRYDYKTVAPDYSTIRGLDLSFLIVSEFAFNKRIHAHRFPIFVPNDYLYDVYGKTIEGHEKMEKGEIYAHAVEDFIRRQGGFGVNNQPVRERIALQKFIYGDVDEIAINGKTYHWPPREATTSDSTSESTQETKKDR